MVQWDKATGGKVFPFSTKTLNTESIWEYKKFHTPSSNALRIGSITNVHNVPRTSWNISSELAASLWVGV
jgi:hypothetical protein